MYFLTLNPVADRFYTILTYLNSFTLKDSNLQLTKDYILSYHINIHKMPHINYFYYS